MLLYRTIRAGNIAPSPYVGPTGRARATLLLVNVFSSWLNSNLHRPKQSSSVLQRVSVKTHCSSSLAFILVAGEAPILASRRRQHSPVITDALR